MGRKRNQYTKEYKVEAVCLIVEEGRPISEGLVNLEPLRVYCTAGKRSLRKEK